MVHECLVELKKWDCKLASWIDLADEIKLDEIRRKTNENRVIITGVGDAIGHSLILKIR